MNDFDPYAPEWDSTSNVFAIYLGQDYELFGDTPENAVRAYVGMAKPHEREAAARGVRRVLDQCADEAELHAATRRLGAELGPPTGTEYRPWLSEIADILERPPDTSDPVA